MPALLAAGRIDEAGVVAGAVAVWADSDPETAWTQAQIYRALGETAAFERALERLRALAGERRLPDFDSERGR